VVEEGLDGFEWEVTVNGKTFTMDTKRALAVARAARRGDRVVVVDGQHSVVALVGDLSVTVSGAFVEQLGDQPADSSIDVLRAALEAAIRSDADGPNEA